MLNETYTRRFNELADKFTQLPFVPDEFDSSSMRVDMGDWMGWATSAQSLIRAVYGEASHTMKIS